MEAPRESCAEPIRLRCGMGIGTGSRNGTATGAGAHPEASRAEEDHSQSQEGRWPLLRGAAPHVGHPFLLWE